MSILQYRRGSATGKHIAGHLRACDKYFVPLLSTRVDIDAYAQKLSEKSVTFEAWSDDMLIGLVAIYLNENKGFITNVSVDRSFQSGGIASRLLFECMAYAKQNGIASVELEVGEENSKAIRLYRQTGFKETKTENGMLTMSASPNSKLL